MFGTLKTYVRAANQWLLRTPERALNESYEAALTIKGIEDVHFGGGKISPDYGTYSKSAQDYFQAELKKYLNIAKVRLTEFKTSSSVLRISNQQITEIQVAEDSTDLQNINVIDRQALILKKLRFIDEVVARYSAEVPRSSVIVLPKNTQPAQMSQVDTDGSRARNVARSQEQVEQTGKQAPTNVESISDKTGVLPRSILKTVDRIKRELDPKAEEVVVENFRTSKSRTIISLRFILLLVIIPLLTQQVSKNFVVGPIVDHFRQEGEQVGVFLNYEMEEEALDELRRFEERIRFEILIGKLPPVAEEEIAAEIRSKAAEVEEEYRQRSSDAIKNVFADIFALGAFAGVIATSKREIAILKSFLDELIYGLSDSAKAFIIILFTDTFVGFHSPHGWEVLLEGVSRHLGLPANRDFIFLFIATFPVILDTIFKYWIFRYLNRISPSAVATYKNMNE